MAGCTIDPPSITLLNCKIDRQETTIYELNVFRASIPTTHPFHINFHGYFLSVIETPPIVSKIRLAYRVEKRDSLIQGYLSN